MVIDHRSRWEAKRLVQDIDTSKIMCLISINDTERDKEEMRLLAQENNVPFIGFVTPDNESAKVDAKAIERLISQVVTKERPYVIVHCWAGISRSAGVAKAFNDYYKLDLYKYRTYKPYNRALYNKTLSELMES